ncbi:MAG: FAD:protein FMN transferase [Pseudomonadota bacterium]
MTLADPPTMHLLIPPNVSGGAYAPGGRPIEYQGSVFGCEWSLKLVRKHNTDAANDSAFLDQILGTCRKIQDLINAQMSLWLHDSQIAQFNALDTGASLSLPEPMSLVMAKALAIAEQTQKAYSPWLYEAVDQWGFGVSERPDPVSSGLSYASEHKNTDPAAFGWNGEELTKQAGLSLDLNGIAKGYSVDLIADVLCRHPDMESCLVEIGGELKGYGLQPDGMPFWVDLAPDGQSEKARYRAALYGWACATSGKAERFHVRDGKSYSHILDPQTCASTQSDLVGATVLDTDCAKADALATALVVMGKNRGLEFVNAHKVPCLLAPQNSDDLILSDALKDWVQDD